MTTKNPKPIFSEDSDFFSITAQKKPVFFFDYDGTLTPIVSKPELALLSQEMKELLNQLSQKFTVAIVTGRDLADIKKLVELEHLIYSGSHGFQISGPEGLNLEHEKGIALLPQLDRIEKELIEIQKKYPGTQVDRKRYAVGLHYRNAKEGDIENILLDFEDVLKKHPAFKKGTGKKIVEVKPNIDWHKGKAVLWILEKLGLKENTSVIPIYIGDDDTDEDAFEALEKNGDGIGIMVSHNGNPTHASYSLQNVEEVKQLLKKIMTLY
ncbi:trehalose-phosphatase [Thermophagus xiamenensis]|uniref:Trehalose 6-phosphate phosphatase n=1 Tax=Thermophagus xiamenensis TaxID=385682 RepID=A0A1I1VT76_9BACT|nr:trehalose-phosphatase [Thermophagus xiamenensis]SFD86292.1 trehalose 6-phosphate phosphatase/alpha,alpha-trehalase [Thermophagus xiamenensis]